MLELKQIFRKTCNPSVFEEFDEKGLQLKSVRHLSTEEKAKIKRAPFSKRRCEAGEKRSVKSSSCR